MKRAILLLMALLLALGATGGTKTYKPPFKLGPSGGDRWNYVSAERDGTVTVLRAFPLPPEGVKCSGQSGWAKLKVERTTRTPQRSLRVAYTNALVDPYTILSVSAKTGRRHIGYKRVFGPIQGDGTVKVPLHWPKGREKRTVRVLFGLELTSGCPAFDGGRVEFTKVTLSPKRL